MKELIELVKAARQEVARRLPFLATAAFSVRISGTDLDMEGVLAGMSRDGILYLNKKLKQVAPNLYPGIFLHELKHLILRHWNRAEMIGADNLYAWNLATDMEINVAVKKAGFKLPKEAVFPKAYGLPENLTAEEYYRRLLEKEDKRGASCPIGQKQTRHASQGVDQRGEGKGQGSHPQQPDAGGKTDRQAMGYPYGGSASDNQRRSWEMESGLSQVEIKAIAIATAEAYREWRKKHIGSGMGTMDRMVEELLTQKINWQSALAGAFRGAVAAQTAATDYSYKRPSRRYQEFVAPKPIGRTPKVAVVLDTSGSISKRELTAAVSELQNIIRQLSDRISYVVADDGIHATGKTQNWRRIQIKGGGGTDMRKGIEKALEEKPDVIVVMTDGYTPWPDSPPKGAKVIACLLGNEDMETPKWMGRVVVSLD